MQKEIWLALLGMHSCIIQRLLGIVFKHFNAANGTSLTDCLASIANEEGGLGEQPIHLLQCKFLRFWKHCPEEYSIGECCYLCLG